MALSKRQNKRLGSILSVMFKEEVPNEILTDLIQGGYIKPVSYTHLTQPTNREV